ncbi:hypothetical protein ACFLU6_10760, partial [Acidobacteriota bacterium]
MKTKLLFALGVSVIITGSLFNEYVIAALCRQDRMMESLSIRVALWATQVFLTFAGILIIRYRKKLSMRLLPRLVFLMIFTGMCFLVSGEAVIRFAGYRPWNVSNVTFSIEPGGRIYVPNPRLGFTHLPGTFTVRLHDGYSFKVTHGENLLRITHLQNDRSVQVNKEEIWIFGCSFTHGWTLNDEDTYPWLVQEAFPRYEVVNFGTGGYGTLQSLLQFRDTFEKPTPPKAIVYVYGSFHDRRNTLSRQRRKLMAPYTSQNDMGFRFHPQARFGQDGKLQVSSVKFGYKAFPFTRYLAMANHFEESCNAIENYVLKSHKVSKELIAEFHQKARERNMPFIVG